MFAEQEMLGQATVSIDQKKRIILPPFTYREEGDTLILINGYQENFVELMAYEKFCQLFQKIKDDKDIELLRKYYLADFSKRVVDAHYRIILSTACLSILKEPTVFVKAIFDQVFLFSNQDEYSTHIKKTKSFESFPYR